MCPSHYVENVCIHTSVVLLKSCSSFKTLFPIARICSLISSTVSLKLDDKKDKYEKVMGMAVLEVLVPSYLACEYTL